MGTSEQDMPEQFYTIEQVAEMLQVTRQSIYNFMADGRLESYKFGRARRIAAESLQRFIQASKQRPDHIDRADSAGGDES